MATTFTSFKIWADRVIKLLEGRLSSDNRFDQREIIRMLRDATSTYFMAEIKQARKDGDRSIDVHYITTHRDQEILQDDTTEMYYTLIPVNFVYLHNHEGIQRVVGVTRENKRGDELIPINPGETTIYQNLPAGALEGEWCFEPDRDRIWYPPNWKNEEIIKKYDAVDMVIVSFDFSGATDDDQIPVPPESIKPITDLVIDRCLQVVGVPVDKKNDGLPLTAV